MAGRAKEQGKAMAARQKDAAAERVESVAGAVRDTAKRLEGEQPGHMGRYVSMAADRLESFGRQLREKDVDALLEDAQAFARRSPVAFFGGSVLAGFLFARFLKSSAERGEDSEWSGREGAWSGQRHESAGVPDTHSSAQPSGEASGSAPPMSLGNIGG
jgi:hypothetical protein